MSKWALSFTPKARDDLRKLDESARKRVIKRLDWLQVNFDKITPLPLGSKWRGFFKLRVGSWRVIYEIDRGKNLIIVYVIGLRDKVYKT